MAGFCFLFSKCGVQSDCEGQFSYVSFVREPKISVHKYDAKTINAIHLERFIVLESTNWKVRTFWASSLTNHDSHSIHAVTNIGNQSCPQAACRAPSAAQSQNQVFQSRCFDADNADWMNEWRQWRCSRSNSNDLSTEGLFLSESLASKWRLFGKFHFTFQTLARSKPLSLSSVSLSPSSSQF